LLAAVLLLADEAADAGLDDDVAFADRELEVALPAAAIETGFALGATAGGAAGAASQKHLPVPARKGLRTSKAPPPLAHWQPEAPVELVRLSMSNLRR